jgi:hypothetical protein
MPEIRIALVTPAYAEQDTLPKLAASIAARPSRPSSGRSWATARPTRPARWPQILRPLIRTCW